MDISRILDRAADLIQQRGWAKEDGWFREQGDLGPLCAEGAIRVAAREIDPRGHFNSSRDTIEYMGDFLGLGHGQLHSCDYLFTWNDRVAKSSTEVVGVLRAASLANEVHSSAHGRPSETSNLKPGGHASDLADAARP